MTSKQPPSHRKSVIMIVDDHVMVREGVAELINREHDMTVCCGADSVDTALQHLQSCPAAKGCCTSPRTRPDMAIVDISLNGASGLELIHAMKARYADIPVLVMSMHDENLHAERALRAGAKGYIMKQEAFDQVLTAIRQVLQGEIFLSEKMRNQMLQRLIEPNAKASDSPLGSLSDRELEVLRLTGAGLSIAEIAKTLHRSVKTIEANRARIKEKLNLKNNTDFMRFAVQWLESSALHQ